jgi:hypothetical protein
MGMALRGTHQKTLDRRVRQAQRAADTATMMKTVGTEIEKTDQMPARDEIVLAEVSPKIVVAGNPPVLGRVAKTKNVEIHRDPIAR